MADDGTLAKVLFFDVMRQFKLPAGLTSVDAANCSNSVVHAVAALTFRTFGVPKQAVQVMLQTINSYPANWSVEKVKKSRKRTASISMG